jgi:hypothetical protein
MFAVSYFFLNKRKHLASYGIDIVARTNATTPKPFGPPLRGGGTQPRCFQHSRIEATKSIEQRVSVHLRVFSYHFVHFKKKIFSIF